MKGGGQNALLVDVFPQVNTVWLKLHTKHKMMKVNREHKKKECIQDDSLFVAGHHKIMQE